MDWEGSSYTSSFVMCQKNILVMRITIYSFLAATVLLSACNGGNNEETTEQPVITQAAIELSDVQGSPEYNDAELGIGDVTVTEQKDDSVKVKFNFNVKNYELMNQTGDADTKMCSNSDKGQHIHFIMDNTPYVALYEPMHETMLAKNSEHYLLAFLSRSYHESVKSKGASVLYHFKVGQNGKIEKLDDPTTPMVFYSRPKGQYVGEKNTANLLFDFFIWNTELSPDGNHVMANIKGDGVDTTLTITDWKAQFLHNMPMGKPSITLTLVDKDGNKIDGPMTEVIREFTLAADEPITQ